MFYSFIVVVNNCFFFQCIELLGAGCLSDKWMKDLLLILEKNLNTHFENEVQRFERRKDEDYDEV